MSDPKILAELLMHSNDVLPMRLPYGQRWNEATQRLDSPQRKGIGFYGPIQVGAPDNIASEYSAGSDIGDYPSVAPNMPRHLLAQTLTAARFGQPVPAPAADFAENAAKGRIANGRSPFWEQGKDPYPAWSPEQYWPRPKVMPE